MARTLTGERPIELDFYHDTAYPWCRIGKAHLDRALAAWDGLPVRVTYRAYLLAPRIPPEGQPFIAYMAGSKGGKHVLPPMFRQVEEAGRAAGLTFRFDRVTLAVNTVLSHRLLALVPEEHRGAVLDGVHAAYFEEGRDTGSADVLAEIARETGVPDAPRLADRLRGEEARDEVLRGAERALGVTMVPTLVMDGRLAVTGGQPAEAILAALREVAGSRVSAAV